MIDLIFVTGTDTDVGKSVVAAGIVRALRRSGVDAVPMKPVQTGVLRFEDADPALACLASGWTPPEQERDWIMPYMFPDSCSPHLAAARQNATIDLDVICQAIGRLLDLHDFVVVEGAGGLLVPLNRDETFDELIRTCEAPTLVVADNRLGMINHTLLTLESLNVMQLPTAGVVVNNRTPRLPEEEFLRRENVRAVQRFSEQEFPLAELPFVSEASPSDPAFWSSLDVHFEQIVERMIYDPS